MNSRKSRCLVDGEWGQVDLAAMQQLSGVELLIWMYLVNPRLLQLQLGREDRVRRITKPMLQKAVGCSNRYRFRKHLNNLIRDGWVEELKRGSTKASLYRALNPTVVDGERVVRVAVTAAEVPLQVSEPGGSNEPVSEEA